jgi:hypothetical protein
MPVCKPAISASIRGRDRFDPAIDLDRRSAGEPLPAFDCHLDIPRLDLDRIAAPPELLGRNEGRAGASERFVHVAPVIADRAGHGFGGLLGRVVELLLV